jgi:hypothetical protein
VINTLSENCIVTADRPTGERVRHGLHPIMSQTKFHIEPPPVEGGRWEVLKSIANHPKVYWIVARVATEAQAQAIVERLKADQAV